MTLKEARKKARLTQKNLANLINVNQKTIIKWEKNKHIPTLSNWKKLEEALNVSIEFKEE